MPLVLPGLVIGFFVLVSAFVLAGISHSHTAQHGDAATGGFWNTLIHDNVVVQLLGLAQKAARAVVSRVAASQLRHLTQFFAALAFLSGETYKANANTAHAAADAMERLHVQERADVKRLHRDERRLHSELVAKFRTAEAGVHHVGHALDRYEARTTPQIKALRHAIDVTIPRDIARVRTREEALSRDQAKLRERTTSLENGAVKTWEWIRTHPFALATTVFAGAVAVALGRLGLGALRCRNFRNLLSRWGCGLGTLLNDLLGLVVAGLALETVCEFLPFFELAFGAVIGPAVHLLNDVPLGACETPPPGWAKLNVAAGPLPPAQSLGTLPS